MTIESPVGELVELFKLDAFRALAQRRFGVLFLQKALVCFEVVFTISANHRSQPLHESDSSQSPNYHILLHRSPSARPRRFVGEVSYVVVQVRRDGVDPEPPLDDRVLAERHDGHAHRGGADRELLDDGLHELLGEVVVGLPNAAARVEGKDEVDGRRALRRAPSRERRRHRRDEKSAAEPSHAGKESSTPFSSLTVADLVLTFAESQPLQHANLTLFPPF